MVEICLSVAPILRCQTLTRLQNGILLIPPGFEIFFAIVLLWVKRASDKRDVFIASETFIYFLLAMLDVLSHTIPAFGTSLNSFRSLDIVIGVVSFIPLLLYTVALYILTSTDFIPSLPISFQRVAKYVLLAFIPLIVLLDELGSFVGITYQSFGGTSGQPLVFGVGFTNNVARVALSSATLVLVTAYQALAFCIAFYRLFWALSYQRTLEQNQNRNETTKTMETISFRGLAWMVAGTKLGAIETVIGFAQGGFPIAMTRRVLRFLSRACLIIGLVKGVDTVEDFQLYSPSQAQKRRKSMLRAMIRNPRLSTSRHVGGHDFDRQDPSDENRQSVIRLGDPSWMRRDYRPALIDEERATPGLLSAGKRKSTLTFLTNRLSMSRGRDTPQARNSGSSFGSTRRNSWPYANSPVNQSQDVQDDMAEVNSLEIAGFNRTPGTPRPVHQRVTVHIRKDRLPVLELRRFSNLDFLDLIHDPFRDPHARSLSLPMPTRPPIEHPTGPLSAPLRTRAYSDAALPVPVVPVPPLPQSVFQSPSMRESVGSRSVSFASYDRPRGSAAQSRAALPMNGAALDSGVTFGPRDSSASVYSTTNADDDQPTPPTSFRAVGSPSATIASWETPGSAAAARFAGMSRRSRGLSSSTTVSEMHAIALQFPGIPTRPYAVPPRRSMLSQEVARGEFIDESSSEESAPQASEQQPEVVRIPSVKRKPSPLMTEGLVDERMRSVEIEQVVDEGQADVAVAVAASASASYPTPKSAPVPRSLPANPRQRPGSHTAEVPSSPAPSEQGSFDLREVEVVRSASLVRRNLNGEAERGKLVRVKSVGNVPMRSVSASRRVARARDSIRVELGHIARQGRLAEVSRQEPEVAEGRRRSIL